MDVYTTRSRTPIFVKKKRIADAAEDHRHQRNVKIFTERLIGPSKPLKQAQSLKSLSAHRTPLRHPPSRENLRKIMTPSSSFLSISREKPSFGLILPNLPTSNTSISHEDSVIHRNIERIKSLTPDLMEKNRMEKRQQDAFRLKIAKETNLVIKNERKVGLLQAFEDKKRRFEIRMMGNSRDLAVKSWTKLLLSLQFALISLKSIENVKKHRKRVKIFMHIWVKVGFVVGKLMVIVRKLRFRRAILVLGQLKVYIRRWKRRRKRRFAGVIDGFVREVELGLRLQAMISIWHDQGMRVLSFLQSVLHRRDAMVELMVLQWERYETELLSDLRRKAGRRPTVAQRNAMTEVPRYLKTLHCVRYHRTLMLRFLKQLKTYWEQELDGEIVLKPRFPVLVEYEDVLVLHKGAMKIRHLWDESLYRPEKRG